MLSAGLLINVDQENPSWWVWVTDEMLPSNVEEWSGIDDESYVIVSEEHVVDGVANFMAKCIFANPKAQVCFHSKVHGYGLFHVCNSHHSVTWNYRM